MDFDNPQAERLEGSAILSIGDELQTGGDRKMGSLDAGAAGLEFL
jgi:hypothetical protein